MAKRIYEGTIDGVFLGFDNEALFKMKNGTYWMQAQYKYWYHYAYCPSAQITKVNGIHMLVVADDSIPIRRLTDVVESQIDGEFSGWDGDTEYSLRNGQVWRQSTYMYTYKYAYMPEAIVYPAGGGFKMRVEGTTADVRQVL